MASVHAGIAVRDANPEINGAEVRRLRQNMGLSVTELARRVGISQPYMSRIERADRTRVSSAVWVAIVTAVGVADADDLRPAKAAA